jgi:hypothetical protein
MEIEVSNGEIVDKITILQIKKQNIKDPEKILNIEKEYNYLKSIVLKINVTEIDYKKLFDINNELWFVEDLIRIKEKNKVFDDEFIELARRVYFLNDSRAELKKNINIKTKSNFVEEKQYKKYQ